MSLFKRRPNVNVRILKTESLKGLKAKSDHAPDQAPSESEVVVNILDKQQLREEFSNAELQGLAQQIAQLAIPQVILEARQARQDGRIDAAVVMLRHQVRLKPDPDIEEELRACANALEDNAYFQRTTNGQLATVLFDAMGFSIESQVTLKDRALIETRLTFLCEEPTLRRTLETIADPPPRYDCYCMAEVDRPLDDLTLALLHEDFKHRQDPVNRLVHFVVCKESDPATNAIITVRRFSDGIITIPIERAEMRSAVLTAQGANFLQSKLNAWIDNHRLFATTRPVTREGEFFGRANDLKEISKTVETGQSFVILGSRRIGKTSLVRHLNSLGAFRSFLYGFLDIERYLGDPNFDRAVDELLKQWTDDLQSKHPKAVPSLLAQIPLPTATPLRLAAFLDALEASVKKSQLNVRCLAIFDDVNMAMNAQDRREPLWQRGINQLVRRLRSWPDLVIAGLTLWDFETWSTIEREHGGLGKYTPIYLGPLTRPECDTMITYIGGMIGMKFEPDSLAAIYEQTGGQPLWTRFVCDAISRTRQSRTEELTVMAAHVPPALEDFLTTNRRLVDQLVESLKGSERYMLQEVSRRSTPLSANQGTDPAQREALTRLKYYGLIEETPPQSGLYRLRMGLLKRSMQ